MLRSACGEVDPELCEWWTEVQQLSPSEQRDAFGMKRKRRARRGGRGAKRQASEAAQDPSS